MAMHENRRAIWTPHKQFLSVQTVTYVLFIGLGAVQFALVQRRDDFFAGDVTYFELARSIVEKGLYGFDFKPETLLPPGFPAILASLCVSVGCQYLVFSRSMTVFATLGFLLSYELIRHEQGRAVANVSCLLLASSPLVFTVSTRLVLSDLPYFFTSMTTIYLVIRLDNAKTFRVRALLGVLGALFLVGSLLIRSSGIALLTGLAAWLISSFFLDRKMASRRFNVFIPLLISGSLVQGGWMVWAARHEVLQWPMVGGYPQSYIKQLEMKNGNFPELGKASLIDIPSRVAQNLNDRVVALTQLLTRKEYINTSWVSPWIVGPVLLIIIGLVSSILPFGGSLAEWYFVSHETMYLLWPWNFEIRFFLPVAPLACFYLWRGGKTVVHLGSKLPLVVGGLTFPLSAFLAIGAAASWRSGDLEPKLSAIFWVVAFIGSASMLLFRSSKQASVLASFRQRLGSPMWVKTKWVAVPRTVGVVIVAALIIVGIAQQVALGRDNLSFDMTKQSAYGDVAAGRWIAANTASNAIVMARQTSVVYHYSKRKVIWFPPSSDPQILMEGIRKHKVQFIILSERLYSYWLPPESIPFEALSRLYPHDFQLVHDEPLFKIYKFVS